MRGVYASDILAMQARFDKRTLPCDIALSIVERSHCIRRLAQQWRVHKSRDTSNTTLFSRNYTNARNMLTILLVHGDRLNTVWQQNIIMFRLFNRPVCFYTLVFLSLRIDARDTPNAHVCECRETIVAQIGL